MQGSIRGLRHLFRVQQDNHSEGPESAAGLRLVDEYLGEKD
jgi:hypothetical protein